ncbi:putative transporter PB1C11.03 [Cytospora mali]|uniref:Transporter PB1C11.03 n=1 Tax=Cytospora mali TaxID=578113 RepID=A0A194VU42_CYTMA|nr:putative transporter PB1C11.03 [Valsa mali]
MEKVSKLSDTPERDYSVTVIPYNEGLDEAIDLVAGHVDDTPLDPKEARRIRDKIDWIILPLLFALFTLQFVDKSTIGASAVLGLIEDNHLTADQFNTIGSSFYIVIVRLLLGASEGCITNGIMIILPMFYTRIEIGQRLGWTIQCNGVGTIISSFLAFGAAHLQSDARIARWQLLMLTCCALTLLVAIWFMLLFPDSLVKARFLTEDEKLKVVQRIRPNQTGTETKVWKHDQFIEALKDVKTWLFFLFAAVSDLQNGFGTQYALIIQSFGFTAVETTALNVPAGAAQIVSITLSTIILRRFPNSRCWIAALFFIPSVLAVCLFMALPWSNSAGLLSGFYLLNFGGAPSWAMVVGWVTVTTSGHTKKLTVNAIFVVGYALGQTLCTQFWRAAYKPRNYVPWGIIMGSYVGDYILLFAIRYVMVRENKRRDALQDGIGKDESAFVDRLDASGHSVRQRVDKSMLDMTDRENLAFRYAL